MDGLNVMARRVEIDRRAPFKSVKEAVSLFGEKVLAGELVCTGKPKENGVKVNRHAHGPDGDDSLTEELRETKQSLQMAREEGLSMAKSLSSLQEELARTKRELHHLKKLERHRDSGSNSKQKHPAEAAGSGGGDDEKEDVKFVEKTTTEFQKKRYVTFTNPVSVAHHMAAPLATVDEAVLRRHPSLRTKKKKALIPLGQLIGGIFSRKRGNRAEATTSALHA
ncbi:WEB family protein At1g75720-like isoform X2 [Rhodamnia argentea]|uniref:WEB family protein At1g75720-like isoform X2 n=1 Tax=Rhodamnia argentea TaxID=178133 RepID=A0A8B8NXV1_9MYRT|nr:WEB family protein At1g75720-like isoform X2 [Rhodamnia argentea]